MAAKQAITTALQRSAIQTNPTHHSTPTPGSLVRRASSKRPAPRVLRFDRGYNLSMGNYASFVHKLKTHNPELRLKDRPLTKDECDASLDRMYERWLQGCQETAQEATLREFADGLRRFKGEGVVYWESGGGETPKGKGMGKK